MNSVLQNSGVEVAPAPPAAQAARDQPQTPEFFIAEYARPRPLPRPPAMKMHSHLRYLEDPITDLSFTEKSKGEVRRLDG